MTDALADLFGQLEEGVGGTSEEWGDILRRYSDRLQEVLSGIVRLLDDPSASIAVRKAGRETTTHFVWRLREPARTGDVGLYLHEYKPSELATPGYADSVHNHRYCFATMALCGGYLHEAYVVAIHGGEAEFSMEPTVKELLPGRVLTVDSNVFHRVTGVQPRTFTLLLKGPAVTSSSLSVVPGTRQVRTHVPVEGRLEMLRSTLAEAAQD